MGPIEHLDQAAALSAASLIIPPEVFDRDGNRRRLVVEHARREIARFTGSGVHPGSRVPYLVCRESQVVIVALPGDTDPRMMLVGDAGALHEAPEQDIGKLLATFIIKPGSSPA